MDVCSFAKVESITRETETATGSLYKLTTLGVEVQAPTGTDGMPLYEAVEVPDFSGPASDTYVHCSASMPAVLGHWSDEDLWVMHPLEVGNQDDVFGFNAYAHAVYWYVCHGQNIPADEIYTPEQAVAAENYGYKASWGTTQGQLEFRGLAEIKSYFGQSVPEQPEAGVELVSTGTGFVVSREGDVLTNAHVIEQCQELGISQVGGAPEPATLRAASPEADLALLRASTTPQAIASFRDGERLQQGEDIYVYGFPQFGILASSGNITRGSLLLSRALAIVPTTFRFRRPCRQETAAGLY